MRGLKSSSISGKPTDIEIIGALKKKIMNDPQNISEIIKIPTTAKTDNQKGILQFF
jgi:hypothetical protein